MFPFQSAQECLIGVPLLSFFAMTSLYGGPPTRGVDLNPYLRSEELPTSFQAVFGWVSREGRVTRSSSV